MGWKVQMLERPKLMQGLVEVNGSLQKAASTFPSSTHWLLRKAQGKNYIRALYTSLHTPGKERQTLSRTRMRGRLTLKDTTKVRRNPQR